MLALAALVVVRDGCHSPIRSYGITLDGNAPDHTTRARRPRTLPLDTTALTPFEVFAGLAGGIGLFLLGMHLLTEGLKLAAGRALEGAPRLLLLVSVT